MPDPSLRRAWRAPRRPLRDRRGTVAVMLGLLVVPLLLAVALAVDFASVISARSRADLAADAAALAAVTAAANEHATNPRTSFATSRDAGLGRFSAQLGSLPGLTVAQPQLSIAYDGANARFTSTVTYTGSVQARLASSFLAPEYSTVAISGTASATMTAGPYVDIQVLMDVSNSMLIGATPDDIGRMNALVRRGGFNWPRPWAQGAWGGGCAFACHWDSGAQANDFYTAAQASSGAGRVTLRLDVLKAAINSGDANAPGIVQQLLAKRGQYSDNRDRYRLGLYTFSKDVAETAALTSDLSQVGAKVPAVSPPIGNPDAPYETNVTESIRNMAARHVVQAGDGSTASTPRKFVFLLTDGIEDVASPGGTNGRRESALDPAACDALKAKGVSVVVLHTLFYNPDGQFAEISAIQESVTRALQACASSPSLYFAASDTAQINLAVKAMLNAAVATPARLTQ